MRRCLMHVFLLAELSRARALTLPELRPTLAMLELCLAVLEMCRVILLHLSPLHRPLRRAIRDDLVDRPRATCANLLELRPVNFVEVLPLGLQLSLQMRPVLLLTLPQGYLTCKKTQPPRTLP